MSARLVMMALSVVLAAGACGEPPAVSVSQAEAVSICNEVGVEQTQLFVDWDSATTIQRGDIISAISIKCELRCLEDSYEPGDEDYDECVAHFYEHEFVGEMANYACTDSEARIALQRIWRTYLIAVSDGTVGELGIGFPTYDGYEGVCEEHDRYYWGERR